MAGINSNLPEIQEVLRALGDTIAFDRPGRQASLGRDALATVVTAIGDRCAREEAPGGRRWPENKDWALRDPRKRGKPIGVLGDSDNMLAPAELAGRQDVTRGSAVATYGVTDAARQKAEWFTEGHEHQNPRPFYEMDESTDAALEQFLDGEVDRYLGSL